MIGGRDLARLYMQHAPAGLRLAYLLTGDHRLAEDLVQDAFVRVIGRFGQLRDEMGFDAYLRRTVVNLSCGRPSRARGDPERAEERDELWRRLDSVAPRQRAALVLRYYEDLSDEQAAQVLGCSTRALRSLTSRGLQALRTQESVVAR
jgi:DNA-directed RNA polymerase specialized sigma24 family protein